MKAQQDYYIKQLYDFFNELRDNNNRPWFNENKQRFLDLRAPLIEDIDKMIGHLSAYDPKVAGATGAQSMYRIYRDTRFSPDKTPYKTFASAAFSPMGHRDVGAGYYLQISGSPFANEGLYAGLWCPPSDQLKKLRKAIVDNIEEWEEILSDPQLKKHFPDWLGETLKTVPKGYDRNHPLAEILRRKDYGRMNFTEKGFFLDPAWPEKAAERFATMVPLNRFINYSIFEEEEPAEFTLK